MQLRLAATVYSRNVEVIADWLARYFGFSMNVETSGANGEMYRVEMKRGRDEIVLVYAANAVDDDSAAEIVFVVDDIDPLCESFRSDGIGCQIDEDAYSRRIIEFMKSSPTDNPSPFRMFSVQEGSLLTQG